MNGRTHVPEKIVSGRHRGGRDSSRFKRKTRWKRRRATMSKAASKPSSSPASRSAGGVKKLEASYNIVTANEEEIRRANPKSTADLLKISPGMWPESTGGQTGANIEIAGFPGGGDAPYFTTQLMGSPLYGMPTLSFFETTTHLPARRHGEVRRKSCRADRRWCSPADRWAPPPTSCSRPAPIRPTGSLGLTYGDENLYARRRLRRLPARRRLVWQLRRLLAHIRRRARSAVHGGRRRPAHGDAQARVRQRASSCCTRAISTTRTSSSRRFR